MGLHDAMKNVPEGAYPTFKPKARPKDKPMDKTRDDARISTKEQIKQQGSEKVDFSGFQEQGDLLRKPAVTTKKLRNSTVNDIKHGGLHGQAYKKK